MNVSNPLVFGSVSALGDMLCSLLLPIYQIWRFIYEKLKTHKVKAFIEMLVVLLIISVLLLLLCQLTKDSVKRTE